MDIGEIVVIGIVVITIAYFVWSKFKPPTPIDPINLIQEEVFVVKVIGTTILGTGQLQSGFSYATPEQINSTTDLRVSGIQKGDYILYGLSSDLDPSRLPHVYYSDGTEFSGSPISFTALKNPDQGTHTYWVCIYGYKPIQMFQTMTTFIFTQDNLQYIQSIEIVPFNTVWNQPQRPDGISTDGYECFIFTFVGLDPTDFSPDYFNSRVKNAQVATLDQILFSRSKGFAYFPSTPSISFCYDTSNGIGKLSLTPPPITFEQCIQTTTVCNDKSIVFWGNKATFDQLQFSGNWLLFNYNQVSYYLPPIH